MTIPELKKLLENANSDIIKKERLIKKLRAGRKGDDIDSDVESTTHSEFSTAGV